MQAAAAAAHVGGGVREARIRQELDELFDSLKRYIEPELMDGEWMYNTECTDHKPRKVEGAKVEGSAHERAHIPKQSKQRAYKITDPVQFPVHLDMRPCLVTGADPTAWKNGAHGHYHAYVRRCNDHIPDSYQWLKVNDTSVEPISEQEVLTDLLEVAYMLFYLLNPNQNPAHSYTLHNSSA
ncbi:hypothetical protein JKP88DRAFT_287251 [Tribonema minus]|uniref:Peptidase C19 ubiquitin carboxyl-terminal hydrolase domain-containing protein n=1 Tax=Tribonema minus TaxID=303371 RepID=A0A835Z6U6_9STRA|nr:hypothetical protein JKP88DRAFT_287251 [Tribonema minus]